MSLAPLICTYRIKEKICRKGVFVRRFEKKKKMFSFKNQRSFRLRLKKKTKLNIYFA